MKSILPFLIFGLFFLGMETLSYGQGGPAFRGVPRGPGFNGRAIGPGFNGVARGPGFSSNPNTIGFDGTATGPGFNTEPNFIGVQTSPQRFPTQRSRGRFRLGHPRQGF